MGGRAGLPLAGDLVKGRSVGPSATSAAGMPVEAPTGLKWKDRLLTQRKGGQHHVNLGKCLEGRRVGEVWGE